MVLHALVDDLVLLILGQVLSVLGLVLTCRGPEAQKHNIIEGFKAPYKNCPKSNLIKSTSDIVMV